ncbi:ImmA/IrrE family metallo-endopeptidase [Candidatus Parcubacteria bacterium]|nr:ImmA/IrrE family metallo-endopeptidase [Patescibacteria group bacterium]MCG2694230.1 ImmA/IrrE family metallo-endopeptidase [Candidatus Parcubacteria bacterium]
MDKLKCFAKNNLFWLFFLPIAFLLTVSVYLWVENNVENPVVKEALKKDKDGKSQGKKLIVFCFGQKVLFNCREDKKENKGFCSDELKDTILQICSKMKRDGLFPLNKIMIDLHQFDKCTQFEKEKAGCNPFFFADGKIEDFVAGYIFLPASVSSDQKTFRRILSHEIVHALMSKKLGQAGRIVREFFAVYYEAQAFGGAGHIICNNSSDNQSALATYDGDYMFPPTKNNDHSEILSACRYGQLEYLANELISIDKDLFKMLWEKLSRYKQDRIGPIELKSWVGSLNKEALNVLNKYYLFKENKGQPHIVIISGIQQCYIFFYQAISPSKEKFFVSVSGRLDIFRENKLADFLHCSSLRYITVDYSKVQPNDIVRIMAWMNGKRYVRKIYVP